MTLTDDVLKQLRTNAETATQGTWWVDEIIHDDGEAIPFVVFNKEAPLDSNEHDSTFMSPANAKFIASCDPQTLLALLDRVQSGPKQDEPRGFEEQWKLHWPHVWRDQMNDPERLEAFAMAFYNAGARSGPTNGGWIGVEREKPPRDVPVLMAQGNGNVYIAVWSRIQTGEFHDDHYGVTHWQPLPSPPSPEHPAHPKGESL